ncbi:MAG: NUDIX domain-containing protein [Chloroflexota bacterium]
MAQIINSDRIGKTATLRVGCAAVIFDETRTKILLTRRDDNNQWCLPGGGMDPGESAEEACVRELWEETGVHVRVTRLIGIYTSPHRIAMYQDGNRVQMVSLFFEAVIESGELGLSDEVTEFGYFSQDEIAELDLMENHLERIPDAFANQAGAFIR